MLDSHVVDSAPSLVKKQHLENGKTVYCYCACVNGWFNEQQSAVSVVTALVCVSACWVVYSSLVAGGG